MLLRSIASIIFQITYKTQNLIKCQGTLRIKTQSIWKVDRKIYQTKHLSPSKEMEEIYLIHNMQTSVIILGYLAMHKKGRNLEI